jgi:cytidylate kinase
MDKRFIITIGRECGSGGKLIGEKLAEELGVKCYDKELLTLAAKQSGLCEDLIKTHDERPSSSFLYSLVMDTYAMGYASGGYLDMPINHKIFLAQFEAIKKLAKEENCVIVGRCADYALEDDEAVLSVFITANEEDKLNRIMEDQKISKEKARDIMIKTDKRRASYYNYYSSKRWSEAKSYNMCVNSSILGIDGVVKLIKACMELKKV